MKGGRHQRREEGWEGGQEGWREGGKDGQMEGWSDRVWAGRREERSKGSALKGPHKALKRGMEGGKKAGKEAGEEGNEGAREMYGGRGLNWMHSQQHHSQ